jgi:hypothetical protein
MKTTEDQKRYPIASDTYEYKPLFQECLVKVGEKWFVEVHGDNEVYVVQLTIDEVLAWIDSSKHHPNFKRSIFADKYFSRSWEF